MQPDPAGEGVLVQRARCQRDHGRHHLGFGRRAVEAVEPQEDGHRHERHALVAVSVRVVAGEPESVGRSQRGQVTRRVIDEPLARACQG
jgi:hypothetical protein